MSDERGVESREESPRGPRPGQGGRMGASGFDPDRIKRRLRGSAYGGSATSQEAAAPGPTPEALTPTPMPEAPGAYGKELTQASPGASRQDDPNAPASADFIGATNLGFSIPESIHVAAKAKATRLGIFEFKYAVWALLDGFAVLESPALDDHIVAYVKRYKEWERQQGRGRRAPRRRTR